MTSTACDDSYTEASSAALLTYDKPGQDACCHVCCGTCRMPLSAQKQLNQTMELPNPKATLTSAVAMRPPASSFVGDDRAPSTPDANLEKPYLQ